MTEQQLAKVYLQLAGFSVQLPLVLHMKFRNKNRQLLVNAKHLSVTAWRQQCNRVTINNTLL